MQYAGFKISDFKSQISDLKLNLEYSLVTSNFYDSFRPLTFSFRPLLYNRGKRYQKSRALTFSALHFNLSAVLAHALAHDYKPQTGAAPRPLGSIEALAQIFANLFIPPPPVAAEFDGDGSRRRSAAIHSALR